MNTISTRASKKEILEKLEQAKAKKMSSLVILEAIKKHAESFTRSKFDRAFATHLKILLPPGMWVSMEKEKFGNSNNYTIMIGGGPIEYAERIAFYFVDSKEKLLNDVSRLMEGHKSSMGDILHAVDHVDEILLKYDILFGQAKELEKLVKPKWLLSEELPLIN